MGILVKKTVAYRRIDMVTSLSEVFIGLARLGPAHVPETLSVYFGTSNRGVHCKQQ